MSKDRDWLDYVSSLLLPAVIALGGIAYTAHSDSMNRKRVEAERTQDEALQALERDSGYVRLLASTNDRERDLGIKIIEQLSKEHKFSADLIPVVAAIAGGRPSDPATQKAAQILKANVPPASAASAGQAQVYIQIAREDQRAEAKNLQLALQQAGFGAMGIELVPGGTVNSYVRYFSRNSAKIAARVNALVVQNGVPATVQDFSASTPTPLSEIEVWIGSKQP